MLRRRHDDSLHDLRRLDEWQIFVQGESWKSFPYARERPGHASKNRQNPRKPTVARCRWPVSTMRPRSRRACALIWRGYARVELTSRRYWHMSRCSFVPRMALGATATTASIDRAITRARSLAAVSLCDLMRPEMVERGRCLPVAEQYARVPVRARGHDGRNKGQQPRS